MAPYIRLVAPFPMTADLFVFFFQPLRNDGYVTESMMCFWILFSLISKYSSLISVFVRPAEICRIDDLAKKKKKMGKNSRTLYTSSTSIHAQCAHRENNNKNFDEMLWSTHKIRLILCLEHQDKYTAAAVQTIHCVCVCTHNIHHISFMSRQQMFPILCVRIYLTQR